MPKIVDFPILPHLKKYIYTFYRLDKSEPVPVNMRSSIGIAMKHILREKKKVNKKDIDRYSERVSFDLCDRLGRFQLKYSLVIQFNIEYDRVFKENLRQWVMAQFENGVNNRVAVMNFLKYYNIKEDEYSYESAYRDWLRFKRKEYDRKLTGETVIK